MNLAFVTLLLIVILLPGFSYQYSYHSGKFSKKYIVTNIFNDIGSSLIPALTFHFIALSIIKSYPYSFPQVSFSTLGGLLMGVRDEQLLFDIFEKNIGKYYSNIALYLLSSVLTGLISGFLVRYAIRLLELDKKHSIFRFDNEWYYLLSGEIIKFSDYKPVKGKDAKKDEISVIAKVLVVIGNAPYIYIGVVERFFLNKNGLESLYLNECRRIPMPITPNENNNDDTEEELEGIPLGNEIVIMGHTILNIDLDYQPFTIQFMETDNNNVAPPVGFPTEVTRN